MKNNRRIILVSAYACEPLKGSEPGVGWNWVLQMAKNNTLHVITRANNKELIEEYLPDNVKDNLTFHYYDTCRFILRFKNKAKRLYLYYFLWQIGIIPIVRGLIRKERFDYSMHLTFGSMWMPTFLPFFRVPFIWGPIGGGDGEPYSFLKVLPLKQKMLQFLRRFMVKTSFLNPLIVIPAYRAVSILLRTKSSEEVIPLKFHSKVHVILETAIEAEVFNISNIKNHTEKRAIRLITTGRLIPSKNILSTIKALKHIPSSYNLLLTVIGSGSEEGLIRYEIKDENLEERVKLIAGLSRKDLLFELSQSDIFLFPSLREGGSWSLMEAMAAGLPVICLKWSGMEIITDDESAIRLPVTNQAQMPKDMANAICYLADNPELMQKMGNAGRERIRNVFNWESKGVFMDNLLNELDSKKNGSGY